MQMHEIKTSPLSASPRPTRKTISASHATWSRCPGGVLHGSPPLYIYIYIYNIHIWPVTRRVQYFSLHNKVVKGTNSNPNSNYNPNLNPNCTPNP